ncbi:hypothetical protein K0504_09900 [Neiella marina]|uniref:PRTRC system protein B n=1 Tax=Neiella holothuriorum TaxID=2870530 RepID=A0ABS7EGA3_9GAMM|nr:hypothetical protein [Neiella holothuriorum]MBW8191350.1 hypothetical protein [Neiella holothuriorum]
MHFSSDSRFGTNAPRQAAKAPKHPVPLWAMVFYGTSSVTAVTRHSIEDGRLGMGELLTPDSVVETISSSFNRRKAASPALLPEKVLHQSDSQITWYTKRQRRSMWFRAGKGVENLLVEWPALIWSASRNGACCKIMALPNNSRPNANTKLYVPPLMNLSSNGLLCQGSARLPKQVDIDTLTEAENCLFDSQFTHVNCAETIRGIGSSNAKHIKFWRHLSRNGGRVYVRDLTFRCRLNEWIGERL